jgi:polar amino acid transport system substrate-binding protein
MFASCDKGEDSLSAAYDKAIAAIGYDASQYTDTLVVAISPDFAPMEFYDTAKSGDDAIVGFDVILATFVAKELGMKLKLDPMSFDACMAAVASGNADLAISGFSWTAERAEKFEITDYYVAGENETEQVLITLKENAGKYTTVESMAGLKVGAQAASLQEGLCKEQLPDNELMVFTDINTGVLQLKKGDFQIMAVATGNADAIIAANPDLALAGFEFDVSEEESNNLILLKKGNDELTAEVNKILAKALEAGKYGEWYAAAEELAGIGVEISYDENGNPITG